MAKKTNFLQLVLPALGEFFNRWNVPVNENFQKIDDFANQYGQEIIDARGGSDSLDDRISTSINPDGSLKEVPEVAVARSSKVYGSGSGSNFFSLDERLEAGDDEVFQSRQGLASLRSSLAWAGGNTNHNCLIEGPTNPLTYSGANVTLNGGTTAVVSNINGYRHVTAVNDQITISGSAGTYYLYLDRNPTGKLVYTTPSTSGSTGLITSTNKLSKYTATGTNLIASGVKVGHILEITAPGGNLNLGRYIVLETAAENPSDLANDSVHVIGEFSTSATGLSAAFYDLQAPTFGFTATPHSKNWQNVSNRVFIGRCVFDGSSVTSLVAYAYQARYEGFQQVTLSGGDFNYSISHNLGFIPKRITIYASQANDFSQPLELLSVAKMTTGSVSITAGDQTTSYTAPVLRRSVVARCDDTKIDIKNAQNGIFYEDFSNSAQTSGYLFVVVER